MSKAETSSDRDRVTVERTIPAPADRIFELLASPARHHEIDGSGTVEDVRAGGPERLSLGAKFGMGMRQGFRYSMVSTVIEFDEGRRIAWAPRSANPQLKNLVGGRVWRYELDPVEGGTRVRETWDISEERGKWLVRWYLADKTRTNMEKTLARIEQVVTGPEPA